MLTAQLCPLQASKLRPTQGTKEGNVEMAVRQALLSAKSYTASVPAYTSLYLHVSTAEDEFLVVHGPSKDLQFKCLKRILGSESLKTIMIMIIIIIITIKVMFTHYHYDPVFAFFLSWVKSNYDSCVDMRCSKCHNKMYIDTYVYIYMESNNADHNDTRTDY